MLLETASIRALLSGDTWKIDLVYRSHGSAPISIKNVLP
jgi:hypothetical protein